ncbi:MAG: 16S rRNA (adenine(1518)-N(6)/adenine(1519)-N(6))-dimethyltransferase RsmA [Anaerohalosphaeraceae bacterium]|nr:16S rRNA (adenine(1518)-N(6)/adenine(1519)-N(6))-dimethyltransferase RsmA [Anaerohalosphaeraceae bacterium]
MQSKQQIQQLLAAAGVEPNKRLGQHFLIDKNLLDLLLKNAAITTRDVVLEIGTGTGTLTAELVKRAGAVIAVEYDSIMAKITESVVSLADNFTIFCADALENKNTINHKVLAAIQKAKTRFSGRMMLVANLPYNVASSVMVNLLSGETIADTMVVTVQKEMADRMVSPAGSGDYGTLSIFMGAMGSAKLIRKLSPKVFWPPPKVSSAIIRFDRDSEKCAGIHNVKLFKDVVGLFMSHRRKMMRACVKFADGDLLKIHNWHDIFERAFIEPHHRPEELAPADYVAMANLCHESLHL